MKNSNQRIKGFGLTLLLLSTVLLQACVGEQVPPFEQCVAPVYGPVAMIDAPLYVEGQQIKDQQGRVVVLRGVNTSGDSKVPPFTPLTSAEFFDPLPGWGMNTLRLLFTWEAFEPKRCDYEQSYLDYYEQVVEWAAERDLYVIVDFHQDAYSRFSVGGCGEGFPEWAVTSTVEKKQPDNGERCESWGSQMVFDFSHHKTWANFHADTEGVKSRYVDMVTAVADRMAHHSNVIGYELINEPWGTNNELADFYEDVGAAIRSRDPDTILFVPPHALASSGALANNIRKPSFGNFVYSPHYYDPFIILSSLWLGADPAKPLNRMADQANEWNVPLLIGEYGAPANAFNVEGYMDAYNKWLNQGLVSGTQWNYTPTWNSETKDGWNAEDLSIVDDSGNLRRNFIPRPYPQAIAGTANEFYADSNRMVFRWLNDPSLGETKIYVPNTFFDNKELILTGGLTCQREPDVGMLCSSTSNAEVSVSLE